MELVDVVDSKSTAGDSVPVRVRSPAPIKAMENDTFSVAFILCWKRTRTHLNATRMSVARCGWTQRNLNFCPKGQKCESSPVTGTKIWDTPTGYPIFFMSFGLEPQVRVWPVGSALPVADAAEPTVVQRSTIDAGVHAKERVGHRKPDTGTLRTI